MIHERNERYVIMREPRFDQAVACEMLFQAMGWDVQDLASHVIFEDQCTAQERESLGDLNVREMFPQGSSACALLATRLGAEVVQRYRETLVQVGVENAIHGWRRARLHKIAVADEPKPIRMNLSYVWAASYMYGVNTDRYAVLRALMDVARRVIAHFDDPPVPVSTRSGPGFSTLFPEFDGCANVPATLPGCAKADYYAGIDTDLIQEWVKTELQWFFKIRQCKQEAAERLMHNMPETHLVEGSKRLDVRYVHMLTHFDAEEVFDVGQPDLVIAHSPTAGCTGIFARHDLNLKKGMEKIHAALDQREKGCWTLADNPDGETPRVINGTLGRMPRVQSRMGADEDAMIGLLRDVAAGRA